MKALIIIWKFLICQWEIVLFRRNRWIIFLSPHHDFSRSSRLEWRRAYVGQWGSEASAYMTEATNYMILSTPMAHTFLMHGCRGEFIVSVLLIIGSNTLSRSQTLNKFPSHSTSTGFSFPPRQAPFLVPLPRKSFATFLSFDKLVSCTFHRPLSHPSRSFSCPHSENQSNGNKSLCFLYNFFFSSSSPSSSCHTKALHRIKQWEAKLIKRNRIQSAPDLFLFGASGKKLIKICFGWRKN